MTKMSFVNSELELIASFLQIARCVAASIAAFGHQENTQWNMRFSTATSTKHIRKQFLQRSMERLAAADSAT
jgi:hypothetical protein